MNNSQLPSIDINCNLGESFGIYNFTPEQEKLLNYITSVNIATNSYSGDAKSIIKALKQANDKKLVIGASIGYADPKNFGLADMELSNDELLSSISSQIGLLSNLANQYGLEIKHIRPHGALSQRIIDDMNFASRICRIITNISPWLYIILPTGKHLHSIYETTGIQTIGEVELDCIYNHKNDQKKISPKYQNLEFALEQLKSIIYHSRVITDNNRHNRISFRTIHFNNDQAYSLELIKKAYELIKKENRIGYFDANYQLDMANINDNYSISHYLADEDIEILNN